MPGVRRFVLAGFSGAALAVACAGGECEQEIRIPVKAGEACPPKEAAANTTASYRDDPAVDAPPVIELLVPGTVCWYLATFPGRDCPDWMARSAEIERLKNRTENPIDCGQGKQRGSPCRLGVRST